MKAKLSKNKDGGYTLSHYPSGWDIGSTDHEWVSNHTGEQIVSKLSLKNCQAIERGYDLDKLKCDYIQEKTSDWVKQAIDENAYELEQDAKCFIEGFQKALELMGDKKFSEADIKEVYSLGEAEDRFGFHDFLQQKNQTEWNVEIVEECLDKDCDGVNRKGTCISTGKPKLDEHNCLILKRL